MSTGSEVRTDSVGADARRAEARRKLLEQRLRGQATQPATTDSTATGTDRAAPGRDVGAAAVVPLPDGAPVPLSSAQERLWFMEQVAGDSGAYTVHVALRLTGGLDVDALRRALDALVGRHAVLRTRIVARDGVPAPQVEPALRVELPVVDLAGLPADEQEARARELASAEITRPFDLAAPEVFRATVYRLADDRHVLLLAVHHVAADGWSIEILLRDLAADYAAFRAGNPSPLSPLPVSYADYAHWQRARLTGPDLAADLGYWREQLAGLGPLDLPTDAPRPPQQTFRGGSVPIRFDADLGGRIRALANDRRATVFMVLLAAWQAALGRQSGQADFAVGSPVAGRTRPELNDVIGVFLNMLTLRADLTGDPTFAELLDRVRDTALDAYAHQELPFERLVEALNLPRDVTRPPLFQAIIAWQNFLGTEADFAGLTAESFDLDLNTTRFDLELHLADTADGAEGYLVFNRDLFTPETATRLVEQFRTLLTAAVTRPETRLSELPVLTDTQRRQLLDGWNDSAVAYPDGATLHDLVARQVARTPTATAVVAEDGQLTYAELDQAADLLARRLRAAGVPRGGLVAVCAERSRDLVVALLGVLKAGAAYLPLDASYPAERLRFMLDDAAPPVLLTQQRLLARLPGHAGRTLLLDDPGSAPDGVEPVAAIPVDHLPADEVPVPVDPDDAAYVIYTSGSTGKPKGAVNTHRAICNRLAWMQATYRLTGDDAVLQKTAVGFDVSVWEFFWPLLAGARLVLAREGGQRDATYLRDLIVAESVTTVHFVPSMLGVFLAEEGVERCGSLRRIICSGEELPVALARRCVERLPAELHNLYGPTEAAIDVTAWHCRPEALAGLSSVPLGGPIHNIRLYVLDEALHPVPVGVPGELYLGGVGLARGYLNRPELTAQRFVPDPYGPAGGRLYRTGDRARWRPDGTVEYLGRLDHQIKLRGFRIELGEIEAVLREQPGIADVAVLLREDVPGDPRITGYLVPTAGTDGPADAELRTALGAVLPEHMVPSAFVRLDALPVGAHGKLDRNALPAPERGRTTTGFVAPRTDNERHLAEIWAQLLGVEQVGIDDNFFELGGHSLLAIRVVARAREVLDTRGGALTVMDIFKHPTVRRLAELCGQDAQARGAGRLLHELSSPVPAGQRQLSLICIPDGGGSAILYQPLAKVMPAGHSLYAASLPGHDPGAPDELPQPLAQVAERIVAEVLEHVEGPVAVVGHCINSALAVEIALRLEAAGRAVRALYVEGSFPVARIPGRFFDTLNRLLPQDKLTGDRSFRTYLRSIGGGADLVDDGELQFIVRNLRHDFREGEEYFTRAYADPPARRLTAPVISVVGEIDPLTDFYEERYREWELFGERTGLAVIPDGGHFFVRYQPAEVAEVVTGDPDRWLGGAAGLDHPSLSRRRVAAEKTPVTSPTPATATTGTPGGTDPSTGRPSPVPVTPAAIRAGIRTFAVVSVGQMVSLTGSALTAFAIGLWVYLQTGSLTTYALIAVASVLPSVLISPLAGAVVDRSNRRTVMLIGDGVAGTAVLALALLALADSLQVWQILPLLVVVSLASAFHRPAYNSAVPQLVPKQFLGHANGFVQFATSGGQILAPLVAVGMLTAFGLSNVLLLGVAAYALAVVTLLAVRFPAAMPAVSRDPLMVEIREGLRYCLSRPSFRSMIGYFAVSNFFDALLLVLVTPLVLSFASEVALGQVSVIGGVAAAVGALAMGLWGGPKRYINGVLAASLVADVAMLAVGLRPSLPLIIFGVAAWSASIPMIVGCYNSLIQVKVPFHLQGRVFSLNQMLSLATMPLGYLLAPLLVSQVTEPLADQKALAPVLGPLLGEPGRGIGLAFVLVGVLLVSTTLVAWRYNPIRRFDELVPDATPTQQG